MSRQWDSFYEKEDGAVVFCYCGCVGHGFVMVSASEGTELGDGKRTEAEFDFTITGYPTNYVRWHRRLWAKAKNKILNLWPCEMSLVVCSSDARKLAAWLIKKADDLDEVKQ